MFAGVDVVKVFEEGEVVDAFAAALHVRSGDLEVNLLATVMDVGHFVGQPQSDRASHCHQTWGKGVGLRAADFLRALARTQQA